MTTTTRGAASPATPESAIDILTAGARARRHRWWLVTGTLGVLILILATTMLTLGEQTYGLGQVLDVLRGQGADGADFVIGTLRLPRMAVGLLAGAALGMAGCTFQTMLRNPLASPDIIGITSGASAAAVFCIVIVGASQATTSLAALIAGVVTAAAIYFLAQGRDSAGGRFILIGIGVGAMLDSVVAYLLLAASQWDIPAAMRWLSGSLNGARASEITPVGIAVLVGGTTLVILTRNLRALELGDPAAVALGIKVDRTRMLLILCAVALASFATASTGPIAFVAFLSGPIATRLLGPAGSPLIPAALVGATLTLAADQLGQYAFGTSYPVGVVTGVLGAPYLLFLLVRMNRSGGSA